MHDIRLIREDPGGFDAALKTRGLEPQSAAILEIDARRRAHLTRLQELQNRRNAAAKEIGAAKAAGDHGRAQALIDEVAGLKAEAQAGEEGERAIDAELEALLSALPNLPADGVPEGEDEAANVEIRRVGAPPEFTFTPRAHEAIGAALGMMDFETAQKVSGARFAYLSGALARLERALAHFMLDIHTGEFGYRETQTPLLVNDAAMYGSGQLPKFAEDLFRTEDGRWLIPTSEVSLANLVRERILDEAELPWRVTAWTPCFRAEAGAAGRDTRGMIRQHQFSKVELVSVTTPEQSDAEHERMTACAEEILKRLGLAYRVVILSTGDMGFGARKTYDIEVWLPGQEEGRGAYREISSCSNCGDFQARRMAARCRKAGEKETRFVHTLNGSGLAVGRSLIAVLENYQREDGSVAAPDALKPYMGGLEVIRA